MNNMVLDDWMASIYSDMGMHPLKESPFGCGTYCMGDGFLTKGYFWNLTYANLFSVTKCEFVFLKDVLLHMPPNSIYIALRLDQGQHLAPGKIMAYMEERGLSAQTVMKSGSRVAYTEVLYTPSFYRQHLDTAFMAIGGNPIEILKNMGSNHNWSAEMMDVLSDIQKNDRTGRTAELYYVAKAYELMAELLAMGVSRLPKKNADYECILRVIAYIDKNYIHEVRQTELVHLAHMSATKLKNIFHQFTGSTITDYISEKRADHAAHLLADSDTSIEQIAKEVGFDTPTGFTTSFKKRIGVSPSEYRRQMRVSCIKNPSEIKNLRF